MLETRASSLSGDNSYQALSNQQRLIPSLTYGCQGKIGRILVAAQNRGRSGNRNRYPEIFLMRLSTPSYYIRMANFTLNEYTDIKSPNVLEFIASSSTYARQDDVIRIYQPQSSDSVYQVYHEPGVGPNNYYISGITSNTRNAFPVESVSSQDTSQPLFIVELGKAFLHTHKDCKHLHFSPQWPSVPHCRVQQMVMSSSQTRLLSMSVTVGTDWMGQSRDCVTMIQLSGLAVNLSVYVRLCNIVI